MFGRNYLLAVEFLDVLGDKADNGFIGDLQGVAAAVDEVNGDGHLFFVRDEDDVGIGGIDTGADIGGDDADRLVVDDAV